MAVLTVLLAAALPARAQDTAAVDSATPLRLDVVPPTYKPGSVFPLTLVNGVDLLEPFLPLTAIERGDVGRVTLGSVLPYGLLAFGLAGRGTDQGTLDEISRWKWAGIDESKDNYPMLWGLTALAGLSTFLPAPAEDGAGYSVPLRIDRLAVFGLSIALVNGEVELLKPVFDRTRPDGHPHSGRPSGHAATAFAAMAYFSDVIRDTLRPQDEANVGLRVLEETATLVPYLGAFYVALERVHGHKHYLSDTLLGGALGVFTTQLLYEWSFLRTELGGSWLGAFDLSYQPGGFEVACHWSF